MNVIVIAKDDRVRRQVEQHLQELGMDGLRFATFKTNDEFQSLYFRERTQEEKAAEEKPDDETNGEEAPS